MSNVPTTADRGTVTETNPDRTSDTALAREAVGAWITLFLASAGFFLITLDILIVNVALTQIERELGGGTVGQQWVWSTAIRVRSRRCCYSPGTWPTASARNAPSASASPSSV
jgi:hypothetical protein